MPNVQRAGLKTEPGKAWAPDIAPRGTAFSLQAIVGSKVKTHASLRRCELGLREILRLIPRFAREFATEYSLSAEYYGDLSVLRLDRNHQSTHTEEIRELPFRSEAQVVGSALMQRDGNDSPMCLRRGMTAFDECGEPHDHHAPHARGRQRRSRAEAPSSLAVMQPEGNTPEVHVKTPG